MAEKTFQSHGHHIESQQDEVSISIEKSTLYALGVFVPQRNKPIVLPLLLQGMQGLRGRPGSRGDMGPIVSICGVVLL